MLLYAMGGVLSVTASEGRDPVKIGLYAPLFLAGDRVAAYTMGAFFSARRDGIGERADLSIQEILATSMDRGGTNLVSYQYSGALYFQPRQPQRSSALPWASTRASTGTSTSSCNCRGGLASAR